MRVNGNLNVVGLIRDLKVEMLDEDPINPAKGRIWFSNADSVFKYFDGENIQPFAAGANLANVMQLDGSSPMTGDLILSSEDQTEAPAAAAVSKAYMESIVGTKQDAITGAVTSVLDEDLTAGRIVVTDENGKIVATSEATAMEASYLAGVTSSIQAQLDEKQSELGFEPLDSAGDGMTGILDMNNNRIIGIGAPVDDADAVRKADLESAIMGLDFQADVLGLQVDDTLDPGETPAKGDRYILTDVSALHENFGTIEDVANDDIVQFDGEQWFIAWSLIENGEGVLVWNRAGAEDGTFQYHNGSAWGQFGGVYGITAGFGLQRDGNTISVNKGAGISEFPDSQLGIDVRPESGLWLTLDGEEASNDPAAQLAIRLAEGSLSSGPGGLRVAASGLTGEHFSSAVAGAGLNGGAGEALRVHSVAGSNITVDETGVSVNMEELRTQVLARDGAEAMTGPLLLNSADQSGDTDLTAVSKGFMDAAVLDLEAADEEITSRLESGYFVYEGNVASDSHTVVHNMGNKYVQVTVVDTADEVVIPESITYIDNDSLAVTFTNDETCRVIVTGLKAPVVVEPDPEDPEEEPTDPEDPEVTDPEDPEEEPTDPEDP